MTALAGAMALVAAGVATVTAANSEAAVSATVAVNVGSAKGTVPTMGQGLNAAVWDGRMNDASQPALLKGAGVRALRYPGGSYGDIFHWKDNTATGGYVAPGTGFDQFMTTAKAAGTQPVLIANYGSGTAQEAADWVTYANKTKGYGVTYWEIGNEVYGNGHYGSGWEKDDHADKSPKAYATNALEYISKMKAVDPSIKIGVVLTTPGNWPDGQKAGGDSADWNNTVLSIVGGKADFGIIHWYPTSKSATENLGKPSAEIPTMTSSLRSLYAKYNAANMGIAVTEMNAAYQDDSATAGLFAADSYLTWWENGVFNTDWWQLRNGNDGKTSTNDDGTTNYNEAGIVSVGGNGAPPVDTPFPTYYGLTLAGRIGAPGDTLVAASSNNPQLIAHAVKTASGGVNVLLINEDLNNSTAVSLSGISAGGVTVEQWKKGDSRISSTTQASAGSITVPPYSLTLLKTGGGAAPSPTPTTSPTGPTPTTSNAALTTAAPTPTGTTGGGNLPSTFAWSDQGPLISPKFPASKAVHAIKDASVVKYDGEYLVYASTVSDTGYSLAYTHFSDFAKASEAPQYHLSDNPNIGNGYRAAPQVFYFAPKKTWFLVYQQGPPAFSTTTDPTKPETWSAPTNFFGGWDVEPDVVKQNKGSGGWLDFTVICDDVNCYLFFSDGNGNLYRSQTTVANFPNGFTNASTVLAMKGTKGDLFEGSNVYKVKGTNTYLLLVEGFGDDGKRVFRSWTTTNLAGEWKPLAATTANPFASTKNVTFAKGKWTNDISHGDAVRDNPDQTSEIDPCNLRFMYQGLAPDATGDYNSLPWKLGLLTLTNSTCR
jgi:hypothetical protein